MPRIEVTISKIQTIDVGSERLWFDGEHHATVKRLDKRFWSVFDGKDTSFHSNIEDTARAIWKVLGW